MLDIAGVADVAHEPRRAADRRQHVRDAVPVPADRVRRRHRRPLGDQVHRRPRHDDRRRRRRQRRLRLVERPLPGRRRSVARLPRAGLPRDVRHVRLPDEAARRVAARPRRGAEPVQRVPVPAGARDAAAADGAARRERARRRASSSQQRPGGRVRCATPACPDSPYRPLVERYLPRGAGAVFAFDLARRPRGRARASSRRSTVEPPRQRRRRAQPGHPPGAHDAPPALRRGAGRRRDRRRDDPPLGRPRGPGRPALGPRPRPARGGGTRTDEAAHAPDTPLAAADPGVVA